jgi:hypothetical protein
MRKMKSVKNSDSEDSEDDFNLGGGLDLDTQSLDNYSVNSLGSRTRGRKK